MAQKNPHAQALGRLGGKARAQNLSKNQIAAIGRKGGDSRFNNLSPAERKAALRRIAMLGVAARRRKR